MQTAEVSQMDAQCTQRSTCHRFRENFENKLLRKYIAPSVSDHPDLAAAAINLADYTRESYFQALKKVHTGNAVREARKADKAGFVCHPFMRRNFVPDIYEINTSKVVRSGGKMKEAYNRTIEEMGGPPNRLYEVEEADCPVHNALHWGIFEPLSGYKQGDVITDEKLLGYINVKRQGNLAIYTSILGHGDYLRQGIMYRLHYAVMDWLFDLREKTSTGPDLLMYGAANSGGEGLMLWKRRGLFEPMELVFGK
jgi:hypothetical protein